MTPRLNEKLTLEKPVETSDAQGGSTVRWVALGHIWGAIEYTLPSQDDSAGFQRVKKRVRIIVRVSPAGAQSRPRPDQRFRQGDRIFDILAVETAQRAPGYLLCHCQSEEMT